MGIEKLYERKGQLITEIEVAQAQLATINQEIANVYNQNNKPMPSVDEVEKTTDDKD